MTAQPSLLLPRLCKRERPRLLKRLAALFEEIRSPSITSGITNLPEGNYNFYKCMY